MPVNVDTYALTTTAAAKDHLGIPSANTQFDDLVNRFINEASARIERYCSRRLKRRTNITEYHDGFANDRFLLGEWPAVKPSEVWIDNTSKFTDTTLKLATSDYRLDEAASGEGIGVVLLNRFFPKGTANVKIVYDAGYSTIPADLEGACLWTVSFLYDMRNSKSVGVETAGKNQESITYRGDLPPSVLTVLDSYKRLDWPGVRAVQTR